MAHIRTLPGEPGSGKAPEWLQVIWAMEELDPGIATTDVKLIDWHDAKMAEEYPHFRVIFRNDPSVSIFSKTEHGDKIMRAAAEKLGIYVPPARYTPETSTRVIGENRVAN